MTEIPPSAFLSSILLCSTILRTLDKSKVLEIGREYQLRSLIFNCDMTTGKTYQTDRGADKMLTLFLEEGLELA